MESPSESTTLTAWADSRLIAAGSPRSVATKCREHIDRGWDRPIAIFDDLTGDVVDIDFQGTLDEVLARLGPPETVEPSSSPGPGRPRLGVVSREVSLLPRHWDWLNAQSGGASVTLRRLVEVARKESAGRDRARQAQQATHRFMWSMASDLEGFEEASRAFFARDYPCFMGMIAEWPEDIRNHLRARVQRLAELEKEA